MSSKVQPISGMEDTASVSSTVIPKVSLFAKKTGFVIPKNKLSGSLVPVFRGSKKPGGADVASEESTKQVLRKTKWGPDLTQDAFVRKGRALAYQVLKKFFYNHMFSLKSSFFIHDIWSHS